MADFKISRIRFTWKGDWVTGTSYTKDDIVRYGGKSYVCLVGHAASPDFNTDFEYVDNAQVPPVAIPKWVLWFDGVEWKNDWTPNTFYDLNDIVRYGSIIYQCVESHTSAAGFIPDPSVIVVPYDSALAASYSIGDIISYNSVTYEVTASFTNNPINPTTPPNPLYFDVYTVPLIYDVTASYALGLEEDQGKWLSYARTDKWRTDWISNTRYVVNDIVKYGGITYRCIVGHTSDNALVGATLETDRSKWEIVLEGEVWKLNWQISTIYKVNDVVKYGGIVYRCLEEHKSATVEIPDPLNSGSVIVDPVASTNLGLEADDVKWEIVHSGVEYRGTWNPNEVRYRKNDVVKYGGGLWRVELQHSSNDTFAEGNFVSYIPGLEFENIWDPLVVYQPGDIVRYGGYSYFSNTNNIGQEPANEPVDWTLLALGFKHRGEWNPTTKYLVGDTIRRFGQLYVAVADSTSIETTNTSYWELVIPGEHWKHYWVAGDTYVIGDLVTFGSDTYRCILKHVAAINNSPEFDLLNTYWVVHVRGEATNVMYDVGDLRVQSATSPTNLSVGTAGQILRIDAGQAAWDTFGSIDKVYYVALSGVDDPTHGDTLERPWRTVRYACERVTGPATIFIKTGVFEEVLPIIVPANVALVGDELRSTMIKPARSLVDPADAEKTAESLAYIRTIITNVIGGTLISAPYNTVVQQNTIVQGSSTASAHIDDTIGEMVTVITTGVYPPIASDVTETTDAGILLAITALNNNKEFIAQEAVAFVQDQYPTYEFVTESCLRDMRTYVESWAEDLLFFGNYKTMLATRYYRNAVYGSSGDNMFFVRNGTGIRNMTLQGLYGTLGPLGVYETRRPTGGAFVSLDPGRGPDDERAWITTKSPYVQNVTTFGTGCTGLKVDAQLHNGGNRSVVANDFTQVLSDGIGCWVSNLGLVELVSVFSYYGHIGYLAESGGKIRATNGNSSYGTFGCVAEGVDPTETPLTATINNRGEDAQITSVFAGQQGDKILKIEFSNAGQNYTTANYTISGAGFGATAVGDEFRNGAMYEARIVDTGINIPVGGTGFITAGNNAQGGTSTSVTFAVNEERLEADFLGMRIVLTSGTGVGQYGYITAFNEMLKVASVARESDDQPGWDHIIGDGIEPLLDTTTVYSVEPRIAFSAPTFTATDVSLSSSAAWTSVAWGGDKFVAIAGSSSSATSYSSTGSTWQAGGNLPASANWSSIVYGNGQFVAVADGESTTAISTDGTSWSAGGTIGSFGWSSIAYGSGNFVVVPNGSSSASVSTDDGANWIPTTLPASSQWTSVAYGAGKFVAIASGTDKAAISINGGLTWLPVMSTLPASLSWSSISYGNGKFVAVATGSDACAHSLDGITWFSSTLPAVSNWSSVNYGQGVFLAVSNTATAATSADGLVWISRSLSVANNWQDSAFNGTDWAVIVNGSASAKSLKAGATTIGRAIVENGKITAVKIWEPGSGYSTPPTITITCPLKGSDPEIDARIGNGVLASPSWTNRGVGYRTSTTTATVSGDGYADIYPIGKFIRVSGLSRYPRPGANIVISGITDTIYKLVLVQELGGVAPNYEAIFQISPIIEIFESPAHGTSVTIREKYSQVRLTGHDFLEIGVGNFGQTNYPTTNLANLAPENEIVEKGGGRCFYTSTDQDGNFRVGELFKVEQSTGIVTISADFFDLQGLEELSLGGVAVGGSGVVIREFSTDNTFAADSNNVVPTQRAIKAYIARRIAGGGSDAQTGSITAGIVKIGPYSISSTTDTQIDVKRKMNIEGGIGGMMLAMMAFTQSFQPDQADDYFNS